MPLTPDAFIARSDRLRDVLVEQGRAVQKMADDAFTAVFDHDAEAARRVIAADDQVDRTDVKVEQASVALLIEAAHETIALADHDIRQVLTVVKVNNELERLADAAVAIAEGVLAADAGDGDLPPTFRVMANSIIGIIRDAVDAFERGDASLARIVLASENTIEAFTVGLLREAEQKIARGDLTIERAFILHSIAGQCERMADYCTNIAEQVIYVATGAIVRHTESGWVDVEDA